MGLERVKELRYLWNYFFWWFWCPLLISARHHKHKSFSNWFLQHLGHHPLTNRRTRERGVWIQLLESCWILQQMYHHMCLVYRSLLINQSCERPLIKTLLVAQTNAQSNICTYFSILRNTAYFMALYTSNICRVSSVVQYFSHYEHSRTCVLQLLSPKTTLTCFLFLWKTVNSCSHISKYLVCTKQCTVPSQLTVQMDDDPSSHWLINRSRCYSYQLQTHENEHHNAMFWVPTVLECLFE